MGLDMFARVRNEVIEEEVDFDGQDGDEELHYWRKHPNLHGWMRDLYNSKGGTSHDFNCDSVQITLEDLDELEVAIKSENLPHTEGFFFGESNWMEERVEDDLDFIQKARRAINEGQAVYYDSWW